MPFNLPKFICLLFIGTAVHPTIYGADLPGTGNIADFSNYFFQTELKTYNVKVTTKRNQPVLSAVIRNLNTNKTARSDKKGEFTIEGNPGDSLRIAASGFRVLTYVLTDKTDVAIFLDRLEDEAASQEQPVERIYTTLPAHLSLASTEAAYTKDIIKSPVTNVRNALIGRLAGLYTVQSSGGPGVDAVSLTSRGQAPLVIVDGVVANLTLFSLEDVESATLVKDALGTAMLGVRGSPGALLITTRKGKESKQQISFTAQTSFQKSLGVPRFLNAYEYAQLYNEARLNDSLPVVYPDSVLVAYRNRSDLTRFPDVNWRETILNDVSRFDRYTLNATGGNRFARYFVSVEHVNQKGFFKTVDSNSFNTNNDFKSYSIRSNIDVSVSSKLTGGIYLLGRILNSSEPGATTATILQNLLATPNNAYPVFTKAGLYGGNAQFTNNLWAQTIGSGYRLNYKRDMLANFYLKRTLDEVTKGLWIQAKAAFYANLSENINRSKAFAVFQDTGVNAATGAPIARQYGSVGTQVNTNSIDYQGRTDYEELSLGYDRTFMDKHGFKVLMMANRDNSVGGSDLPYTISGISGLISYNYAGKYIAEATFGYNGSNRYPEHGDYKRGFFPAFGLGWNMEKEDFMKGMSFLSRLKLFASYGRTGSDDPGYFSYFYRFFDAAGVPFGTSAGNVGTQVEQTPPNRGISFEQAKKFNVGMQGSVLKDHLGFFFEYFNNEYYDLLQQRGRSITMYGNDFPRENIGRNRYTGWESRISWMEEKAPVHYFITAHAGMQNSEVLDMDEVTYQYPWMQRTGHPVGQRFGYIAEGLFQSQAEINSSPPFAGYSAKPGDIKYRDLNGDRIINQFDITAIGEEKPLLTYGLGLGAQWKGFDFSALIQGVGNREILIGGPSIYPFWAYGTFNVFAQTLTGNYGQAYVHNLGRWTPQNAANATFPRLNIGTNTNNQAISTYWLKSGDYVRLKNIEIGYTLPLMLIKRARLQAIRVFVSGYNVYTHVFEPLYGGRDPEISGGLAYPLQRLTTFGINIKL